MARGSTGLHTITLRCDLDSWVTDFPRTEPNKCSVSTTRLAVRIPVIWLSPQSHTKCAVYEKLNWRRFIFFTRSLRSQNLIGYLDPFLSVLGYGVCLDESFGTILTVEYGLKGPLGWQRRSRVGQCPHGGIGLRWEQKAPFRDLKNIWNFRKLWEDLEFFQK